MQPQVLKLEQCGKAKCLAASWRERGAAPRGGPRLEAQGARPEEERGESEHKTQQAKTEKNRRKEGRSNKASPERTPKTEAPGGPTRPPAKTGLATYQLEETRPRSAKTTWGTNRQKKPEQRTGGEPSEAN